MNAAQGDIVTPVWRLFGLPAETAGLQPGTYDLLPGAYALALTASRNLSARVFSLQRYLPGQVVMLTGCHLETNRVFDPEGAETGAPPRNGFAEHLFGGGS